ncbi:MAG: Na+/H+ antiporter subunit D [Myxococcales bacterium]|nr:Na+/H+ antiporter subunit D [Myxococcales bacterium]
MNDAVVWPVVLPFAFAVASLSAWRRPGLRALWAAAGHLAHLLASIGLLTAVLAEGVQVLRVGGWPSPYAISLVADPVAALLTLLAALVGAACVADVLLQPRERAPHPAFHALMLMLLGGVSGAFLTGDLFNLFVWFEVLLMASFVLLALEGRPPQLEGAVKYVVLNLMSSAFFLTALGVLYGKFGTLDLAHLATVVEGGNDRAVALASALFLVAFGVKAGLFPLFFWLPAAYHTPTPTVSALFAGLLTKVGVYALLRVFTLVFPPGTGFAHALLLGLGTVTMVVGVLGAASSTSLRRVLSFHVISQIGYMVLAVALQTPLALAAAIFYLLHHILVKTNLFLVGGLIAEASGGERLSGLGGLLQRWPLLALVFAVPALSLAGLPPLSGFFAKLAVLRAAFDASAWVPAAMVLLVGLFTLYSMVKLWQAAFWQPAPPSAPTPARPAGRRLLPAVGLASLTVAVGVGAGPLFEVCLAAGADLMARTPYLEAVLGVVP